MAVDLEKELSKEEILERYLNSAYFGHRAYGIYAASEIFFSKTPKELTPVEAATLAGLVKSPSQYDPASSDQKEATERRNYVLDNMTRLGYLSPDSAAAAKTEPIRLRLTYPPNDCAAVPEKWNSWGFLCDYLKNWWSAQPAFGENRLERMDKLRRGGYRIVLSMDPKIQKVAEQNVGTEGNTGSPFANGIVVSEPGTGRVKAMAVNRTYSLEVDENPLSSNPEAGPERAGQLPEHGGAPDRRRRPAGLPGRVDVQDVPDAGRAGRRDDPEHHLQRAAPVPVGDLRRLGADQRQRRDERRADHVVRLRQVRQHLLRLAGGAGRRGEGRTARRAVGAALAYRRGPGTRLPVEGQQVGRVHARRLRRHPAGDGQRVRRRRRRGRYCEAMPVSAIYTRDGTPAMFTTAGGIQREVAKPRCRQVVSADAARAATDAARCPTGDSPAKGGCGGWSTADSVRGTVGRPVAGKTGTTDSTRSAWFVGYTPELAAASFISDPDNPFNAVGDGQSEVPIAAVANTLRDALKGRPLRHFTPPSDRIVG